MVWWNLVLHKFHYDIFSKRLLVVPSTFSSIIQTYRPFLMYMQCCYGRMYGQNALLAESFGYGPSEPIMKPIEPNELLLLTKLFQFIKWGFVMHLEIDNVLFPAHSLYVVCSNYMLARHWPNLWDLIMYATLCYMLDCALWLFNFWYNHFRTSLWAIIDYINLHYYTNWATLKTSDR